jgi:flagellar biosynthesis protein FlhF
MKIKKIRAKNFGAALALVKKELGTDAVILSSEDKKGNRAYVEVTAAVDHDIEQVSSTYSSTQGSAGEKMNVNEFMALKDDIKSLKNNMETIVNSGFEFNLPVDRKNMYNLLKSRSIKEEFALKLIERAGAMEDIKALMSGDMSVPNIKENSLKRTRESNASSGQKICMLLGPTGSGKTTTVAKLASMAIREGKKVAMVSLDTFKIGAAEQIRIYSRIIGIPLDIVSSSESLHKSINRFSDRDLILIDTTGHNPKDGEYIERLNEVCNTGIPIETQLLLSASSDCDFLMETHKYYRALPIDYVAFTKTDEAVKLGSIYNLCRVYQKPVAYITTGQRVPGNIEFVDSGKLTNLILRTGSA